MSNDGNKNRNNATAIIISLIVIVISMMTIKLTIIAVACDALATVAGPHLPRRVDRLAGGWLGLG